MPFRSGWCLIAKGAVRIEPPRFRQKISTQIGIALIAINGPEVPMPIMPIPMRI